MTARWVPAITQGEYDDFYVVAAVDGTTEEAQALADRMNADRGDDDTYRVHAFPLVEPGMERVEYTELTAWIGMDGGLVEECTSSEEIWPIGNMGPDLEWTWAPPRLRAARRPSQIRAVGWLRVAGYDAELVASKASELKVALATDPKLRGERFAGSLGGTQP